MHTSYHSERTGGETDMPSTVIIHQRWNGQAEAVRGASRWTAVELGGQLTTARLICVTQAGQFLRRVKLSCMKEQVNTWFLVLTSTRASADGANGRTGADGLHHGVKEIGSKENFRCFNSDHWAVFHCHF